MIAVTASATEANWNRWLGWMEAQPQNTAGNCTNEYFPNIPNIGPVKAYQQLYERNRHHSHIAFLHDDLEILEPWTDVEREFADPKLAIIGFGGATGLGLKDIYKIPYDIWQLQRTDYFSNQTDWSTHGTLETGAKDVAVVDGFAMVVRTQFLDDIGGWSGFPFNFHCYDLYLCLMAKRLGWKVRMVGVRCTHHGGGTSTSAEYQELLTRMGKTAAEDHQEPHVWIYESFRDELPVRV